MDNLCLFKLASPETRLIFGGKGNALLKLASWGYPIPLTYAIPANLESLPSLDSLLNPFSDLFSDPYFVPCIVRSSADQEDHNELSLAGAFLSLRVNHQDEWKDAIKNVIQSILKTRNELGPAFRAGFLVQPFIETEKRGVVFSRDPENLWSKVQVLEWLEGSAELQVTNGMDKTEILKSDAKSLPEWSKKVFEIAEELEGRFKSPVDIEWGIKKDGSVVLFQCRPIGGSNAQFVRRSKENPEVVWTRDLAAERFPSCMTPMGWDIIEDGIPVNLVSLYEYFGLKASHPRNLAYSDEGWIYHSESFFKIPGGLKINLFTFLKKRPLFFFKVLFYLPLLMIKKEKASVTIVEALTHPLLKFVKGDMERAMKIIPGLKDKLKHLPITLDRKALKREFLELTEAGKIFFKADLPIFLSKDLLGGVYQKLWNVEPNENDFLEYASQLPDNISLKIWSNPSDISFSRRTWDVYYSGSAEMKDQLLRSKTNSGVKKILPAPSPAWRKRLGFLHQWMMWDEEQHHYSGLFLEVTRKILIACGHHMVKDGVLSEVNDVFFLKLKEAKDYIQDPITRFDYFRHLAQFRRRRFETRRKQTPLPVIPPKTEASTAQKSATQKRIAQKQKGMSQGKAEGPWIYLDELSDLLRLPDEPFILVTKTANPVWIPLFPKILAWVTERGGPLSHGFVAAREWGIPAVTAIDVEAIRNLPFDLKLSVDGTIGEVRWN